MREGSASIPMGFRDADSDSCVSVDGSVLAGRQWSRADGPMGSSMAKLTLARFSRDVLRPMARRAYRQLRIRHIRERLAYLDAVSAGRNPRTDHPLDVMACADGGRVGATLRIKFQENFSVRGGRDSGQ